MGGMGSGRQRMGTSPDRTVLRAYLCTTKGVFTTTTTTRRTRCISCMLYEKRRLDVGPYEKGGFFLLHTRSRGGPKGSQRGATPCPILPVNRNPAGLKYPFV